MSFRISKDVNLVSGENEDHQHLTDESLYLFSHSTLKYLITKLDVSLMLRCKICKLSGLETSQVC